MLLRGQPGASCPTVLPPGSIAASGRPDRKASGLTALPQASIRPATHLELAPAPARARIVSTRRGGATHRFARGEVLDAVRVQVGEHARQRADGLEAVAVG